MNLSSEFANPWGEVLDLESLHGEVSAAIMQAIHQLKQLAQQKDTTSARPLPMVVLGAAGAGKTHLFARLRRQLGQKAIMVHIRPLVGADMTPRYVLGQTLEQLSFLCAGIRQLDIIAGGILTKALEGDPQKPLDVLDLLRDVPEANRRLFINHIVETHLQEAPDLDEAYFSWLLRLPFLTFLSCRSALMWLGGRDLDEIQAFRLGVQGALPTDRVLPALRTLARLAAPHAPLVLVFDQLENLVGASHRHIIAYGNLLAELVDTVRDVVIVQMALLTEWHDRLRPRLSTSQRDRIEGRLLPLSFPTPSQAESLLRLWTSALPFPLPYPWPFTPQEAHTLCGAGTATPRILLKELRRALETTEAPRVEIADVLSEVWAERLAWARNEIQKAEETGQATEMAFLLDGLHLLLRLIPEFTLLEADKEQECLTFQRSGTPIHIVLMLQANPTGLNNAIKRWERFEGQVIAIREKWRDFKPTWKGTLQNWRTWTQQPRVYWHWLLREDAVRLMALESLYKNACSMDIADPDGEPIPLDKVVDWIKRTLHFEDWTVTLALHGDLERETPLEESETSSSACGAFLHLQRLGVASLERLQRECHAAGHPMSRAQIAEELRQKGKQVHWIGTRIASMDMKGCANG